jgi:hypothetical protein
MILLSVYEESNSIADFTTFVVWIIVCGLVALAFFIPSFIFLIYIRKRRRNVMFMNKHRTIPLEDLHRDPQTGIPAYEKNGDDPWEVLDHVGTINGDLPALNYPSYIQNVPYDTTALGTATNPQSSAVIQARLRELQHKVSASNTTASAKRDTIQSTISVIE